MASEKDNKTNKPAGDGGAKKDAQAKKPGEGKPAKTPKGKVAASGETGDAPVGERTEPRLQTRYKTHVAKELGDKHGLKNPMQHPRLTKIVLNVNMGRHLENNKLPPHVKATVVDTITKVTGQKPVIVISRKSVSNFKLREGAESSAVVTLRRDRMWHFLDRFINLASPRIKDFRGLKTTGFDKQGNYAFGITEQGVFPEINMAEVNFTHGMNINVCFERSTPELSRFVLAELGMPFAKPGDEKGKKK